MMSRTPIALACCLGLSCHAMAQSDVSSTADAPAHDYVVTGSRQAEPAGRSVRPVQVVTAEDLRASGASSLADVLRTLGGVEVSTTGGLGQQSSVFMRGANSGHTVILVDGVRLNSPTSGSATLEAFPLALIERIEVLPGNSSSLYGADAMGGVIQIFTRSAERSPGATLAATAGSGGLRQLSGAYAARHGDTELSLSAAALRNIGDDVTTASYYAHVPDKDGYRDHSLNARVTQHLGDQQQVGLQWLSSLSQVDFDNVDFNPPYLPFQDSHTTTRVQNLAGFWQGQVLADWSAEVRVARNAEDATTHNDAQASLLGTRQDQLSWLNHVVLGPGSLTAGLEVLRQSVHGDTEYDKTERDVKAALLGWRGSLGDWSLQADARRDDNSQYGAHTTGQLSTAWQVSADWRVRASAGTAFKAPTFNDLYYPDAGNPDLHAEKSRSVELGADAKLAGVDLGATVFHNRIRDLIVWQPSPTADDPYRWLPMNVSAARNRGLTLTAATALGRDTRIKLNATFQNPEDADTGAQLQRRARRFGGLHLTHRLGDWTLGTDLTYVGSRFDSATASAASRMGAYTLVALFGTWRLASAT
jgi:vitamin B12 transporter